MEDWRIICPCQRHRPNLAQRVGQSLVRQKNRLRLYGGSVVLGAPFLFGAFSIPIGAETTALTASISVPRLETATIPAKLDDCPPPPDAHVVSSIEERFFRSEVPYGGIIFREARRNGLPPELVAAVVKTESDFRPTLVSEKNAYGLMQLIASTGEEMGADDLFDPVDNVRAGTRYLRYLNKQFDGDQTLMLAAYNAGEGAVRKYGGIPPYKETQNYVVRVAYSKDRYQRRLAKKIAALRAR